MYNWFSSSQLTNLRGCKMAGLTNLLYLRLFEEQADARTRHHRPRTATWPPRTLQLQLADDHHHHYGTIVDDASTVTRTLPNRRLNRSRDRSIGRLADLVARPPPPPPRALHELFMPLGTSPRNRQERKQQQRQQQFPQPHATAERSPLVNESAVASVITEDAEATAAKSPITNPAMVYDDDAGLSWRELCASLFLSGGCALPPCPKQSLLALVASRHAPLPYRSPRTAPRPQVRSACAVSARRPRSPRCSRRPFGSRLVLVIGRLLAGSSYYRHAADSPARRPRTSNFRYVR